MIALPKEETKLMVAVHGWSGIILGLLLYAVVLTGTAAVFAEEIGVWSAGHVTSESAFERPIAGPIQELGAQTPEEYREAVDLFETGDHDLGMFFHRHEMEDGMPVSRGWFYLVGADGTLKERSFGTSEDVFGARNDNAFSTFLVETHVRLHVPDPYGLILTGVLGLAMLVAAISGLLIHRHLFKDIFTLRRGAKPVLLNRDRHSVAGTWSLPFAFVLAFTGSFFSFFGTIGVPIVAMAAFGGDVEALNEAVFGSPGTPDARPAPTAGLDRITADAIDRAGAIPTFATIENFGRADAKVTTYHPPASGDIAPVSLVYNGADGTFENQKPLIGPRPSTGGTLAAVMSPLHFGNFAGIVSKAIWFGLGFAMCYVTYTGLRLWLVRREAGSRSLDWLDRSLVIVGLGLPLALLGSGIAFLLTMPLGTATFWTPAGFLIASAMVIAAGAFWRSAASFAQVLVAMTGVVMVALPPLRLMNGGPGWTTALAAGQWVIVAVDLALVVSGAALLWRLRLPARADAGVAPILQAAE
ncbi:PepSY-associated TM helix domain-containing protein [Novosphingobium sp. M1R2S20]|uniref:PepSY-associated TM helix domain-containing protein n=1 Tax=Novosphingobium rhizovicinum TaxID=3228928 RepID=A0ABV3RBK4_9SPHN